MLWFGPLKGTFYLSTASIMFVCVCWTTPGQVFNVLTSAYRHASRSCDAPLAWDANFALKEQTRDGVDGSQMSHICFTVDPIVAQHPTNKPPHRQIHTGIPGSPEGPASPGLPGSPWKQRGKSKLIKVVFTLKICFPSLFHSQLLPWILWSRPFLADPEENRKMNPAKPDFTF